MQLRQGSEVHNLSCQIQKSTSIDHVDYLNVVPKTAVWLHVQRGAVTQRETEMNLNRNHI